MQKRIHLLLLCLLVPLAVLGQTNIKGTVFSQEDEPMLNATVILLSPADSTMKYFGVTNKNGEYQVKQIRDGSYIMQVSFVGALTSYKSISIPPEPGNDMGKTTLNWESIGEVKVVAEYVPIRFRSDTVEFNANAFLQRHFELIQRA